MGWYLIADAKDTRTVLSDSLRQRFGAELKGIENAAAHGFSTSIHRDVVDQRNLTIFIRSIRSHVSLSHAWGSGYEQYPTRAVHYSSVALGMCAPGDSKQGKSIMAPLRLLPCVCVAGMCSCYYYYYYYYYWYCYCCCYYYYYYYCYYSYYYYYYYYYNYYYYLLLLLLFYYYYFIYYYYYYYYLLLLCGHSQPAGRHSWPAGRPAFVASQLSPLAPCRRPLKTLDANQKVCASCRRRSESMTGQNGKSEVLSLRSEAREAKDAACHRPIQRIHDADFSPSRRLVQIAGALTADGDIPASVTIVTLGYRLRCTEPDCRNLARLILRCADVGGPGR